MQLQSWKYPGTKEKVRVHYTQGRFMYAKKVHSYGNRGDNLHCEMRVGSVEHAVRTEPSSLKRRWMMSLMRVMSMLWSQEGKTVRRSFRVRIWKELNPSLWISVISDSCGRKSCSSQTFIYNVIRMNCDLNPGSQGRLMDAKTYVCLNK